MDACGFPCLASQFAPSSVLLVPRLSYLFELFIFVENASQKKGINGREHCPVAEPWWTG